MEEAGSQVPSRERMWTQQEERGAGEGGDWRRMLGRLLRAPKPLGHPARPSRPLGAHSAQKKGGEVCLLPTPPPFQSEGGMEGGGEKKKTEKRSPFLDLKLSLHLPYPMENTYLPF